MAHPQYNDVGMIFQQQTVSEVEAVEQKIRWDHLASKRFASLYCVYFLFFVITLNLAMWHRNYF